MKRIIKISEEDYRLLTEVNDDSLSCLIARKNLIRALLDSTPLPEGHGKLIDASRFDVVALQGKSEEFVNGVEWVLEQIDNILPVIEEDKDE